MEVLGSEGSDGLVFAAVCGGLLLLAIRGFGVRRVLWGLVVIVGVAAFVAIRTLSVITSRRY